MKKCVNSLNNFKKSRLKKTVSYSMICEGVARIN
jgi:hypothetical protein